MGEGRGSGRGGAHREGAGHVEMDRDALVYVRGGPWRVCEGLDTSVRAGTCGRGQGRVRTVRGMSMGRGTIVGGLG